MADRNPLEMRTLIEVARALNLLQRQLLTSLADNGPALLFELAVSVLKFPEEIGETVQALRTLGLIATNALSGSQFGSEVLSLSERGRLVVRLLRENKLLEEAELTTRSVQSGAQSTPQPPVHETEVDLLRKLGDAAAQQGDWKKASEWYEQALDATRGSGASS